MWKSITGRITLIAVLTAVSIIVLVPSLTDQVPAGWKDRVPKINLGLDLQGGVFLRLAVAGGVSRGRSWPAARRTCRPGPFSSEDIP